MYVVYHQSGGMVTVVFTEYWSFILLYLTALLKLKSETGICAVNTPEVLPVCLPELGMFFPDWKECEISGYGKDKECKG